MPARPMTDEELAEYIRRRQRQIRFDNVGWFGPYDGYWIQRDSQCEYSLCSCATHPHDPDGNFPIVMEKSSDLKLLVDKAKQYRILELQKELKELSENDQYDF